MRILLIEDEAEYLEPFITEIEKQYVVDVAYNGVEGAYLSAVNDYDAIVVDTCLPDIHPVDLCKNTRSANVSSPILLLSDNDTYTYAIQSLEFGADALLSKPVQSHELIAQVRALIRRNNKIDTTEIKIKKFTINLCNKTVKYGTGLVTLRRKEYDILEYLSLNVNNTVSKEKLLDHVWSEGIYMQSNTLEVHIRNLRNALKVYCKNPIVKTVRGYGYRIDT